MDGLRIQRVIDLYERRNELEQVATAHTMTPRSYLARAQDRLDAAELLIGAGHFDVAFTTAYDAYRMAAEAVVLSLGYRVPAVAGAHRITLDVAGAALEADTSVFSGSRAERFRAERHRSEYADPTGPPERTADDARWAIDLTRDAIAAVESMLV